MEPNVWSQHLAAISGTPPSGTLHICWPSSIWVAACSHTQTHTAFCCGQSNYHQICIRSLAGGCKSWKKEKKTNCACVWRRRCILKHEWKLACVLKQWVRNKQNLHMSVCVFVWERERGSELHSGVISICRVSHCHASFIYIFKGNLT